MSSPNSCGLPARVCACVRLRRYLRLQTQGGGGTKSSKDRAIVPCASSRGDVRAASRWSSTSARQAPVSSPAWKCSQMVPEKINYFEKSYLTPTNTSWIIAVLCFSLIKHYHLSAYTAQVRDTDCSLHYCTQSGNVLFLVLSVYF